MGVMGELVTNYHQVWGAVAQTRGDLWLSARHGRFLILGEGFGTCGELVG